ncbi:ABC transporter substrate-binding protein [Labrys monachus]|uniref:ABC-type glycerol-3-phosphate transport system substrate-binding protein n=1 Tax=Labrys monachus TaxID=217067 RepID=A0ABU0FBK3_9HYPH|nr:sugar ABC transporter substrate-binding protein [Labrys monachus]MDQ0391425.1 ABC-type glycerol-3-phosphate transport system substrate-binding protein [Labrys monachus]
MLKGLMKSTAAAAMGLWFLSGAAHADPVVLKFWDNQQTESGLSVFQQEAVKRFEAENPDIKVEVTTIPYPEYQQRLLTAVQAGNGPDVSTVDQIWNAAFAQAGAIVQLDDLASKAGVKAAGFFPGAWESANYKGGLWGIPFNVDVWFFAFVNKKLFSDAGVDPASAVTWQGLEAAAKKLTDKSKGHFAIGLTGSKSEYPVVMTDSFIYSNGGAVLGDDGKCALTSPQAVEALEFYKKMADYAPAGILNAGDEPMRELFLNGTLAIELWPALEQPTLDKSKIDWDLIAGFAPEGKKAVGTFGGWNLVLYKQSAHQEAAWKFIQFMTRQDVNGAVVDLIPANVAAAKDFLQKSRRHPDVILEHLNNAKPRPLSPRYLEVSDIQQTMVQKLLSGTPAADAAKEACQAIDALQ